MKRSPVRLLVRSLVAAGLLLGPTLAQAQLTAVDVQTIINQAVARAVQISPNSVIAVTDREGDVLAVWRAIGATPTALEISSCVSKAGTASFLSSNQNAFTSRTAGFIIQQHFPPGVQNTPTGPLVGVGLSNLFVSDVNRFKKPALLPCPPSVSSMPPCLPAAAPPQSPGTLGSPVAFTSLDGSPGGVPLYKNGVLVGGIGVTGDGTPQPFIPTAVDLTKIPALPACLVSALLPIPPIARDENPFIFIGDY